MMIALHRACTAALLMFTLAALPCSAGIPKFSKLSKKDKPAEPTPLEYDGFVSSRVVAATSAVAQLTGRAPTSVAAFLATRRDLLAAAQVVH